MVSVRVHVMHVPGADPARDAIVARLTGACLHLDPHRRGLMPTWLSALGCAAARDADTWSVICSDDADPCPGWADELPQACQHSPGPVLGLTHFGGYGRRAVERGIPYLIGPNLVWGGAIGYRRDITRPLYRWAHAVLARQDYPHDDVLVSEFNALTGRLDALCARAVFDQPVAKSLLGHGGRYRRPDTTIANTPPIPWDAVPAVLTHLRRPPAGRRPDLEGVPAPELETP